MTNGVEKDVQGKKRIDPFQRVETRQLESFKKKLRNYHLSNSFG